MYLRHAVILLVLTGLMPLAGPCVAQSSDTQDLPEVTDGHRALRGNAATGFAPATEPETFSGFPEASPFVVVSRMDQLVFQPCTACHSVLPVNSQPRKLMAPHPAALNHGNGQFWCLDCHAADNRDVLQTLSGTEVGFDEAYRVCGQCHYEPQKDWFFGAHGKRASGWQEERRIYNCTHCHDPHDPSVKPRAPEIPPPLRKGLEPAHAVPHDIELATDEPGAEE